MEDGVRVLVFMGILLFAIHVATALTPTEDEIRDRIRRRMRK